MNVSDPGYDPADPGDAPADPGHGTVSPPQPTLRVLALALYPGQSPSTRYRLGQYAAPLAAAGVDLRIHSFFGESGYRRIAGDGGVLARVRTVLAGFSDLRRIVADLRGVDVILVQRAVAPLGNRRLLRRLRASRIALAYDFDDAVYLPQEGGRPWLGRIRDPRATTAAFCCAADAVLAGNGELAAFARQARGGSARGGSARDGSAPAGSARDQGVEVLPTVVDTERFRPAATVDQGGGPLPPPAEGPPTVGWVGSGTTLQYLEALAPALRRVQERRPCRILVVAGREPPTLPGVEFEYRAWTPASEVTSFQEMDVGLYPLDDTPWSRGKCGFKALQYLACGVPCVASPVGVLNQIVEPGVTGLHARTEDEWVEACVGLLSDREARRTMGAAGRRRVVEHYSIAWAAPKLAAVLRALADR